MKSSLPTLLPTFRAAWGEILERFRALRSIRRLPSLTEWEKLPRLLSKREKAALLAGLCVFIFSLISLGTLLYRANTKIVPADGGTIREGIVGSPGLLNPVYASARDADRDLVELLYAGLVRFDASEDPVPDLASGISIEEGGRTYVVDLRESMEWSDGYPITADDVVFTVETIQNPRYSSPIRADWVGVKVEKVSEHRVRFRLREAYAPFLERLTLKLIPAHTWKEISPENFPLVRMNLRPVVSGPYAVRDVRINADGSIREIELQRNSRYHGSRPHISSFVFRFFPDTNALLKEARRGNLDAFLLPLSSSFSSVRYEMHSFPLPRYFSLFFNLAEGERAPYLKNQSIREALNLALDKNEIAKRIPGGVLRPISSPVLPKIFSFPFEETAPSFDRDRALALLEKEGYEKRDGRIYPPKASSSSIQRRLQEGSTGSEVRLLQECLARDPEIYPDGIVSGIYGPKTASAVSRFQERHASEILEPYGYAKGTGSVGPATQAKLNEVCFSEAPQGQPFEVSISTLNQPPLMNTAEEIRRQMEEFGVRVRILAYDISELEQNVIKPRDYETLLFGEVLGRIPDPFPFWHSTQTEAPGVNFSAYESRAADIALENIRTEEDPSARSAFYRQFQDIIGKDDPAIFLYAAGTDYAAVSSIRGISPTIVSSPSQRFSNVHEWYLKTKRIWKG